MPTKPHARLKLKVAYSKSCLNWISFIEICHQNHDKESKFWVDPVILTQNMFTNTVWPEPICPSCLAGSSKTAPRIFVLSIVLGAEYSFYVKSNGTYAPTFFGYNNSVLEIVSHEDLTEFLNVLYAASYITFWNFRTITISFKLNNF